MGDILQGSADRQDAETVPDGKRLTTPQRGEGKLEAGVRVDQLLRQG